MGELAHVRSVCIISKDNPEMLEGCRGWRPEEGFDPNPQRGRGSWSDFIKRHAETLWACDFFQKKIWTARGFIDYFLLFFIHVGSRRVHLAGMTTNPDGAWVTQQARNMAMIFQEEGLAPRYLLRDRDSKYTAPFDEVMKAEGIQVVKVGPRAPNMNAHIERFLLSLQSECLDHFIVFGEDHLRHLTRTARTSRKSMPRMPAPSNREEESV